MQRGDVADAAIVGIVFNAPSDHFGEVPADFDRRREVEAQVHVRPVQGALQRRIDCPLKATLLFVHDGADLPGPGVRRKAGALVSDFLGDTYSYRPMPLWRYAHPRPDAIAHPLHAQAALLGGQDIEPHLCPSVDALGELDGSGVDAVDRCRTVDSSPLSIWR